VSITRIKNVFKLLITECPFLIDDKAFAESHGKPVKEQFTIQIDSIRKSLGIDNMDDVELLVLTFYEFAERQRQEALIAAGMSHADEHSDDHASNAGAAKRGAAANLKGSSAGAVNDDRKNGLSSTNVNEADGIPIDDDALVIDNDDIVLVLKEFHKKREERANNADLVGNPRMKKRSNFESEE
jgi:uncharacterized protein YbaA (DUF1428 family)